jgi:hypothetical protein
MHRLSRTDRVSGVVVRYQREHPGELVHIDVKKLWRIPDGGSHRVHGRSATALPVVCWLRWQVEVQRLASGESVKQPLQLPGRRRWRP